MKPRICVLLHVCCVNSLLAMNPIRMGICPIYGKHFQAALTRVPKKSHTWYQRITQHTFWRHTPDTTWHFFNTRSKRITHHIPHVFYARSDVTHQIPRDTFFLDVHFFDARSKEIIHLVPHILNARSDVTHQIPRDTVLTHVPKKSHTRYHVTSS